MKIKALLITFATCFLFNSTAYSYPTARITIKVVDESGIPMEGIQASVTFQHGEKGTQPLKIHYESYPKHYCSSFEKGCVPFLIIL